MLLRPPDRGRWSNQQQLLLLVVVVLCATWLQLADARRQHEPRQVAVEQPILDDAAVHHLEETTTRQWGDSKPSVRDQAYTRQSGSGDTKSRQQDASQQSRLNRQNININNNDDYLVIPDDASAIATLAPAKPVRAPSSRRHQPGSGITAPQAVRSLEDWEVEDFVLLATVDGDLYANDRRTGRELWHLGVEQPMIETKHHRLDSSVLDEDHNPIDHYIWAVEPNRDGELFVWVPGSNAGLTRTGLTMKRIVEELAPHASRDPPVAYIGDKKSTLITLDAATGRVLKWFGSGGTHVNEAESCLRPNALYDLDVEECSSSGTITLGRTEYTVSIQRRDGHPIATLKYTEWGPNNFDNDLGHQYHMSLDNRYIASQYDGKAYGFHEDPTKDGSPLFIQKFSAPVARVFDILRPWDAPRKTSAELVALAQPSMPSRDEDDARMRSNRVYLDHTQSGDWFAMSARAYPLIVDGPAAPVSYPSWSELGPKWDQLSRIAQSEALTGLHSLEPLRGGGGYRLTLPPGKVGPGYDDLDNESLFPVPLGSPFTDSPLLNTITQGAIDSVVQFIKNPIVVVILASLLISNHQNIRRSYQNLITHGTFRHVSGEKSTHGDRTARVDVPTARVDNSQEPDVGDLTTHVRIDKEPQTSEGENVDDLAGPTSLEDTQQPDGQPVVQPVVEIEVSPKEQQIETAGIDSVPEEPLQEKKKKAHRGRRGGAKHKKRKGVQRGDSGVEQGDEEPGEARQLLTPEPDAQPASIAATSVAHEQRILGPIMKMGNLEVNTEEQLGMGSNGTLVFAGKFDGRDVAVKRLLIQFYDVASQETRLLRESDDHPNVIRYYSQQTHEGFLYIALERCAASLADVVEKPHVFRDLATAGRMDLPNVLYQITNGIFHLHSLRIVHRDLKPQNILVNMGKNGKPRLLVSDFGLCKKLDGAQSSFGATTGRAAGTSGWRAPELLLDDDARDAGISEVSIQSGSGSVLVPDYNNPGGGSHRATRAIDIFSLGLVFFYVLTNGSHPFDCGDKYMREVNIRKDNYNLTPLDNLGDYAYEAKDLIALMLNADPKDRPNAKEVMAHPFFWSPKKRLAFLCDVSDHFEKEVRDPPSPALQRLEESAGEVIKGDFLRGLPKEFVDSLGKQRKYTGTRLLDLLRALRNKRNHYEDMSDSLKRQVGALPDGYLSFWTVKFPNLLLACWNVVWSVRWDDTDRFREYYEPASL